MLNRIRPDYYGLFIGSGKVTRFVSVLLTMLNVGTIIWLTWDISAESDRITCWNYDHALCPDNSIIYIGVILRVFTFWGVVHLVHGIYHHTILKGSRWLSHHAHPIAYTTRKHWECLLPWAIPHKRLQENQSPEDNTLYAWRLPPISTLRWHEVHNPQPSGLFFCFAGRKRTPVTRQTCFIACPLMKAFQLALKGSLYWLNHSDYR